MRKVYFLLVFIIGCTPEKDKDPLTYTPFSKSVVHVSFSQDPTDTLNISAIITTNIPKDGYLSNEVAANKAGNYYLDLEIDRPTKISLNLGDEQHNVFLFPNDTTHITVNTTKDEIGLSFYGRAKIINEYYQEKKTTLGYTDIRYSLIKSLSSKSTFKLLKQSMDSVINRELSFLEKYTSRADLPEWFLDYEQSEITYAGGGSKTAMPHANEMMKYFKDTLPSDYYDFLSNIQVDNSKAILSSHYFWFLDDYFARSLPISETNQLTGFSRINKFMSHTLDQSKDQLSGEVKELYHKSNFSLMIKFYADSLAIDSLAKAFQISDYKELVRIAGVRSRNEMEMMNMNKGDTIPEFVLSNSLDSLISIRSFQDQILYLNFWATWCAPCIQNMPELNKLIAQYDKNPRVKFLNIGLESERHKWLASIEKHKLKGVNLMAEGNWNSKLRSYFNIKGIPHYVIINKGNILSENATDKAPKVQEKINAMLTGK
jgi:thiol-disulfide isomerase/thioredoxin